MSNKELKHKIDTKCENIQKTLYKRRARRAVRKLKDIITNIQPLSLAE